MKKKYPIYFLSSSIITFFWGGGSTLNVNMQCYFTFPLQLLMMNYVKLLLQCI